MGVYRRGGGGTVYACKNSQGCNAVIMTVEQLLQAVTCFPGLHHMR